MSFNLLRNSRIFFTTAVGAVSGKVNITGTTIVGGNDAAPPITASNTRELQVLDNFSFSQSTTSDTITLNEAGPVPTRGQRQFNTALNTVEFSMTTYLRPYRDNLILQNVFIDDASGKISFDTLKTPLPVGTEIIVSGVPEAGATGSIDGYNPLARTNSYRIQPADAALGITAPTVDDCYIGPGLSTNIGSTEGLIFKVANVKDVTKAEESCLWNAMFGPGPENGAVGAGTLVVSTSVKTVTGVGTNFTANNFPPGTKLYTAPAVNNPGTFIGTVASVDSPTQLTLRENSLVAAATPGTDYRYYGGAWQDGTYSNPADVVLENSNVHNLQKFGMIIIMDTQAYILDDCCLNQAQIDFGLDAISQVNWSGMAKNLRQVNIPFVRDANNSLEFQGHPTTLSYFSPKVVTAPFLANKLTICDLGKELAPGSIAMSTLTAGAGYNGPTLIYFQAPFGAHTNPVTTVPTGRNYGDDSANGFVANGGKIAVTTMTSAGLVTPVAWAPDTVNLNTYVSYTNYQGTTNWYKVIDAIDAASGPAPYSLGSQPPSHTEGTEESGEVVLEWVGRSAKAVTVMRLTGVSSYDINGVTFTDAGAGYTVAPSVLIIPVAGGAAPTTAATATTTLTPVYSIPLTGGSITISNNITYLTPALIGVVNEPVFSFTGTRSISGTLNAYLRTGALKTTQLMSELLEGKSYDVNPRYDITVQIGGSGNTNHVDFNIPAAVLQVPTIGADPVVSTSINFTGQSSIGGQFDLTQCNELTIKYYAV